MLSTMAIHPSLSSSMVPHDPSVHKPHLKAVEVHYRPSTNVIDVTVFEDRRDALVPLLMQFKYERSMGYAPIHEIIDGAE